MGKCLLDKLDYCSTGLVVEKGSMEYREAEILEKEGFVNVENSSGYVTGSTFVTVKINDAGREFIATSTNIGLQQRRQTA